MAPNTSVFLSLLALGSSASAALYDQVITIKNGSIQGYPAFNGSAPNINNWRDITVWKGIPYGANTAYQNRFKPPQPAAAWNTTLDAKDLGDICPGTSDDASYTISENCLNLNIWSNANSTDAKLPVMMWSPPAGGVAGDARFNGAGMADKGVVFVNYNRRDGTLGWLAHPLLSAEMSANYGTNSSGNWGMLDQQAALKWIHENIAAFGGDPERITVVGQSAGSAATYHLVNSPLVKGLIKGAIIESGVRYPKDPLCTSLAENYHTLEDALETGISYVKNLSVTTLEQLRSFNYSTFVATADGQGGGMPSSQFNTVLDGYAMPSTYMESLLNGAANDVPIMTGNTKDESGASYGLNISIATYLSDLNITYGSWATEFLNSYGEPNSSTTASAAYNAQWSDRSAVGTWMWTQLWQTSSSQPVWNYFWDHAPPNTTQGAAHMTEIPYALDSLWALTDEYPYTETDWDIARQLNGYWVNFIKNQNPNGGNLTKWEAVSTEQTVQQVGNGWGPMELTHVELFEDWFGNLTTVY